MGEKNLARKVVLISGAAGGIGRSIAETFAKKSTHLVLTDLVPSDVILNEVEKHGSNGISVQGDLTVEADVERLVKTAIDTFGRIDILVNNAGGNFARGGGSPTRPLEEVTVAEWNFILDNNLKSVFLLTRAVVPHMKRQGYGRIINMSSLFGKMGTPLSTLPYAAAKAGILGFTRTLAHQLGADGITINAVAPGYIVSGPRLEKIWEERKRTGPGKQMIESIALKKLGTPEDVAKVVSFLASDDASYITGSTIDVLGGAYTL